MLFEEGKKSFGKRMRGRRVRVGLVEDVIEEFIREGREVIDLRGRLRREEVNQHEDHGETERAYSFQV